MTTQLVVRLTGENVRPGEILASDLACLLAGVEGAVTRAATQLAGRAPSKKGRLPKEIVNATRLRLTAIKEGSLVVELAPPEAPPEQESLALDDMSLADQAIGKVIEVVEGFETGFPETAKALSQMAKDLDIGKRINALALSQTGSEPRAGLLDHTVRLRLSQESEHRTSRQESRTLFGTLYEADFEKNTARLRTQIGSSIRVRFDEIHAQSIKKALREQSHLQGIVTYDETTSSIISVELADNPSAVQLELMPGVSDFWATQSLDALVEAQGTKVIERIEDIQDHTISEEEAEAFFAAFEL